MMGHTLSGMGYLAHHRHESTMSEGKYLSLEEARTAKNLERFAEEHPTKGSKKAFDALLLRMARSSKANGRT